PNLAEGEIADGGGVENRVSRMVNQGLQALAQVGGGGKGFDAAGRLLAAIGGLLANEQDHFVPFGREEIDELAAEPAGGEICEPAHFVQRLEGWTGSDDTSHRIII